jgi:hypothetical protein
LSWWQAIERARKLARGNDDTGRPITIKEAVDSYERDLVARGGSVANAGRIRKHLTPTLAAKPVGLLTARELAAWRDALLADGMKPATAVRIAKSVKAALTLVARRDHRIGNRNAWRDGLSGISEGFASRNLQRLTDAQVSALVSAAYAVDRAFGLYAEVLAVTGARCSQVARLTVGDLQTGAERRLMMPCSRKGRGRKPAKRSVPIPASLAAKLASNRPAEAPLLMRSDGRPWQSSQDRVQEQNRAKYPPKQERAKWQRIEKQLTAAIAGFQDVEVSWRDPAVKILKEIRLRSEQAVIGYDALGTGYGGQSEPHREHFYVTILDLWEATGQELAYSNPPQGGVPYGPLIDFFRACVAPVFGNAIIPAHTIAGIIDRQCERHDEKLPLMFKKRQQKRKQKRKH